MLAALSEEMYDDGFVNITNIDISPSVVAAMSERSQHRTPMAYHVMSVMNMAELQGDSFDAVIDKATLDSIMVGDGAQFNEKILAEISRVLRPGGVYINVTFAQPANRNGLFDKQKYSWQVQYHTVRTSLVLLCAVASS